MSISDPEKYYCDHVYIPFLEELIYNMKNKLLPEIIINEKTFELTKCLSKQLADRLPSPLQLHSELELWQNKIQ
ncbi:unnamed protein product [Rotaria magnacalcarata]|uniref:Uncharacterized protein n=1 Tax=Rotaria magnacalcarata TaxID=392030 RepID=A0A820DMI4_9BILA|nr:unnamed protein product [Rotaria magnacalcarata]CAF4240580.1 unnamed protein product [Rotaria magnacalcarata]